jgi:hypothetical protein
MSIFLLPTGVFTLPFMNDLKERGNIGKTMIF